MILNLLETREKNFRNSAHLAGILSRFIEATEIPTSIPEEESEKSQAVNLLAQYQEHLAAFGEAKAKILALLEQDQGKETWTKIKNILDAPEVDDSALSEDLYKLGERTCGKKIFGSLN